MRQKVSALNGQGMLSFQQGRIMDAFTCFRRSLALNAHDASTHNGLGITLCRLNQEKQAVKHFREAIRIDPRFEEAFLNLGAVLRKQGHVDESISCFRRLLKINPKNAHAYSYLGKSLSEKNNMKEAVQCFCEALKLNSKDLRSLSAMGMALRSEGKWQKAAECFQRIVEITPEDAVAHHNLAVLLKSQSNLAKAEQHFRKALALDPGNVSTQHELAATLGKTSEAAPPEYIQNLFDHYSTAFEEHLTKELEYAVPQLFRDTLKKYPVRHFENALDLGCGTGLCGQEIRPFVQRLTGVDLSSKMIKMAEQKKAYDLFHTGDISAFLAETTEKYDLCLAGDVFVYTGNLSLLFKAIRRCLINDAYFLFSTETTDEPEYTLKPSGRYGHHPSYIQKLAKDNGFVILSSDTVRLRKDNREWTEGNLYLLRTTTSKTDPVEHLSKSVKEGDMDSLRTFFSAEQVETFVNSTDSQGCSPLFWVVAEGQAAKTPQLIPFLLDHGAILRNGNLIQPQQISKTLTQHATAQAIKNILNVYLKGRCSSLGRELFLEIGAGDGYLKYLLSLIKHDPGIQTIEDRLVETEISAERVSQNARHGKFTIQGDVNQLRTLLGPSFTSCVISMNVMDTLSASSLQEQMETIHTLLKPNGIFLHIMSSCVHPTVFDDIRKSFPHHFLYPYYQNGYVGVQLLSQDHPCAYSLLKKHPIHHDLCQLFATNADEYLALAHSITQEIHQQKATSLVILLKDYFIKKIKRAFEQTQFKLVFNQEIHTSVWIHRNSHHDTIPGINKFQNNLGALVVDRIDSDTTNRDEVLEESMCLAVMGQKITIC